MKINKTHIGRMRYAKGFTLLEMVIVLGIIGLIIGGAISVFGRVTDGASMQQAKSDFASMASIMRMYKLNNGTYPTTAQGLKALVTRPNGAKNWVALATKVPLDPWKQEYHYKYPGTKNPAEYEIISKGPDQQLNTEDDLSSQND